MSSLSDQASILLSNGRRKKIPRFVVCIILLVLSMYLFFLVPFLNTGQWKKISFYRSSQAPKMVYSSSNQSLDFYFSRYDQRRREMSLDRVWNSSSYSPLIYRSLESIPIIWIDENGDTRWNEAAEQSMFEYLEEKQRIEKSSPDKTIDECLRRPMLIFEQHEAGFFSRHNCFIEQFGQSLYSPWMVVLSYRRFHVLGSGAEDFRGEGLLRYFSPMSTCSQLDRHPRMNSIVRQLRGENAHERINVTNINDLLYDNQRRMKRKFIWYKDFWSYNYADVPHRQWLFNVDRPLTPINYSLPKDLLLDHHSEHIYHSPLLSEVNLTNWRPHNVPYGSSKQFLAGSRYEPTWKDRVFTSFLRSMFVLYFHHFPSRIFQQVHLLAEHWSTYLKEKNGRTLDDMAAIYVRRGDKMPEDSFWVKHHRWRNLSFYVKGLVDEEQRINRRFSSIFVMTDDAQVMKSMLDYADPFSKGTDESYARTHLKDRQILYNVFDPPSCLNPFLRIGFDQFLTTLHFLVQYSQFTVTHIDSNVGRYLTQILYAKRQLNHSISFTSLTVDAPDSF